MARSLIYPVWVPCRDSCQPGGAGEISTGDPPRNGRGVPRTKTGNQTGDCPFFIFRILKAFRGAAVFDFRSIFFKRNQRNGVRAVAKDGSNRGGARPGAGRKRKALTEKISEGKTAAVMLEPAELEGVDVPPVKDFLKSPQKSGRELVAEEVYNETYAWLKARGCEKLVTVQMVEQYAMSVSRWIQCEEIVSSTGFLAKHPTTGAAIASPYVTMSQSYMKQTNYCWMQIYQIVKENCSVEFQGNTPQDDVMERLLRARKGV